MEISKKQVCKLIELLEFSADIIHDWQDMVEDYTYTCKIDECKDLVYQLEQILNSEH